MCSIGSLPQKSSGREEWRLRRLGLRGWNDGGSLIPGQCLAGVPLSSTLSHFPTQTSLKVFFLVTPFVDHSFGLWTLEEESAVVLSLISLNLVSS